MKKYGEVLENVSLKEYNTYKIGGYAKYIIKPFSITHLINLIEYLKNKSINYLVLGKGSNVILPDENYNGAIILLDNLNKINIDNEIVEVEAGINLSLLINKLIENNIGGLENLCGIPGTLGGAIIGNAGCHGCEISDYIDEVKYLENGIIKTIKKEECNFKYRESIFKYNKNIIVLGCKFKLLKRDKEEMLNKVKEFILKRKNTQPLDYPNAGSVFRNPENLSSGKIIEDLGLKNYHINDAYISEKHANFIINKGNATSEDIKELIKYIQKKVIELHGIELVLEQIIIKY